MSRKPIKRGGENTKPKGQSPTPPPAPPNPGCFNPIVTPAPPPQVNMASSDLVAWYSLQLQEEKRRREYYQNIVYEVCSIMERAGISVNGRRIVCGNVDEPSSEVFDVLKKVLVSSESIIPW